MQKRSTTTLTSNNLEIRSVIEQQRRNSSCLFITSRTAEKQQIFDLVNCCGALAPIVRIHAFVHTSRASSSSRLAVLSPSLVGSCGFLRPRGTLMSLLTRRSSGSLAWGRRPVREGTQRPSVPSLAGGRCFSELRDETIDSCYEGLRAGSPESIVNVESRSSIRYPRASLSVSLDASRRGASMYLSSPALLALRSFKNSAALP